MRYVSTRGEQPPTSFLDCALGAPPADGGLFTPERWPRIPPEEIERFATLRFSHAVFEIARRFVGDDIPAADLKAVCQAAFPARHSPFAHAAFCPILQLANGQWALDLGLGASGSARDFGFSFLASLARHFAPSKALALSSGRRDSLEGAMAAYAGANGPDLGLIGMFAIDTDPLPAGGPADARRLAIAVRAKAEAVDELARSIFQDRDFAAAAHLYDAGAANLARLIPQLAYMFTAAAKLGAPYRNIAFAIGSDSLSDLYCGYAALRLGLPVERLAYGAPGEDPALLAFETGRFETGPATFDPDEGALFEALTFEAVGRDGQAVASLYRSFRQSGGFDLPEAAFKRLRRLIRTAAVSEEEIDRLMKECRSDSQFALGPEGARALGAARRASCATPGVPMIALSTHHPQRAAQRYRQSVGSAPQPPVRNGAAAPPDPAWRVMEPDLAALKSVIRAHRAA